MKVNKLWNLSLLLSRWIVSQGWQNPFQDWLSYDYVKRLIVVWMIRLIGLYSAWLQVIILGCSWITTKDRNQFWTPKERISFPSCLLSPELGRHVYVTLNVLHFQRKKNVQKLSNSLILFSMFGYIMWKLVQKISRCCFVYMVFQIFGTRGRISCALSLKHIGIISKNSHLIACLKVYIL